MNNDMMTIDEMIVVLQGARQGKEIQFNDGCGSSWKDISHPVWDFTAGTYRIKPTPRMVPLGPEDVPPGSAIRFCMWPNGDWSIVLGTNVENITVQIGTNSTITIIPWIDLIAYEISRDGGKTWKNCSKEAN